MHPQTGLVGGHAVRQWKHSRKRNTTGHVITSRDSKKRLTLDSDVLKASVSVSTAVLCAFPVELSPLASMLFLLNGHAVSK
jgi:hypothetical protein